MVRWDAGLPEELPAQAVITSATVAPADQLPIRYTVFYTG
jgi:hypothetical protein